MSFQEWLASLNIDAASLTDARRTVLESAWRQETGEPPPLPTARPAAGGTPTPFGEMVTRRQADLARQQGITDACSAVMDAHPGRIAEISQVGETAIAQGWNRERTELELLRRFERSSLVPTSPSSRSPAIDNSLLECSLMVASAVPNVEKLYDERTLQRAHDQFGGRGLSIGEVLSIAARANGWRGHSFGGDISGVLEAAFGSHGGARASGGVPSSYSIPTVLNNVANKSLKVYFMAVDQTWRLVAAIGSGRDFKATTDVALTGGLEWQDLPKNGEIKHGTFGEETYTNQIGTKALMLGLSRNDLINDDIGSLQGLMKRLARGAAIKFNNDFWPTLLGASSAFFDASLGNAGSSTLNYAGLDTALTLFGNITDPDGNLMQHTPKILLVGNGLEATAKNLMSPLLNHTGDTDAAFGQDNPHAGKLTVVANGFVSSTAYSGATTRWYILADPNDVPVIEVKFLNGNQTPTIEQVALNTNMLGIGMRGWYDYGIALQEYRGGVKEN